MTFYGSSGFRYVVVDPSIDDSLGLCTQGSAAAYAKSCGGFGFWRIKSIKREVVK